MRAGIYPMTHDANGITDEYVDDPLGPFRGALIAAVLSLPVWLGLVWAMTTLF